MRRTLFVVEVADVPIVHAAASIGVARTERRRNEQFVALLGVSDVKGWMRDAEAATLEALERRGEASTQELAKDVPALARRVKVNLGKAYEGEIGMASRVLLLLAVEGRIVRTRPRGTWISSQYRWTTMRSWLGREVPERPVADAQAELVRRWLARFGPGTEFTWLIGWLRPRKRAAGSSRQRSDRGEPALGGGRPHDTASRR